MRTTLEIDDDVLAAAKELAADRQTTTGKIISDLVRKALAHETAPADVPVVVGFPILPHAGRVITSEFIDKLLEEDI
jgi:hypothetical protein